MTHSLQVLAAVADLKNRLTPEQVIDVRQIFRARPLALHID